MKKMKNIYYIISGKWDSFGGKEEEKERAGVNGKVRGRFSS